MDEASVRAEVEENSANRLLKQRILEAAATVGSTDPNDPLSNLNHRGRANLLYE